MLADSPLWVLGNRDTEVGKEQLSALKGTLSHEGGTDEETIIAVSVVGTRG